MIFKQMHELLIESHESEETLQIIGKINAQNFSFKDVFRTWLAYHCLEIRAY